MRMREKQKIYKLKWLGISENVLEKKIVIKCPYHFQGKLCCLSKNSIQFIRSINLIRESTVALQLVVAVTIFSFIELNICLRERRDTLYTQHGTSIIIVALKPDDDDKQITQQCILIALITDSYVTLLNTHKNWNKGW